MKQTRPLRAAFVCLFTNIMSPHSNQMLPELCFVRRYCRKFRARRQTRSLYYLNLFCCRQETPHLGPGCSEGQRSSCPQTLDPSCKLSTGPRAGLMRNDVRFGLYLLSSRYRHCWNGVTPFDVPGLIDCGCLLGRGLLACWLFWSIDCLRTALERCFRGCSSIRRSELWNRFRTLARLVARRRRTDEPCYLRLYWSREQRLGLRSSHARSLVGFYSRVAPSPVGGC